MQDISVINWSQDTISLEDQIYILLTYKDKYGFEAQLDLPQDELQKLESINGKMAFHVPNIVADAEAGMTGLQIKLQEDEWTEDNDLTEATKLSLFEQFCEVYSDAADGKYVELDGHYYMVFDYYDVSYYIANRECNNVGGHLVTITSAEEQSVIQDLLGSYSAKYYFIGGHKSGKQWTWVTGEEFTYTNWASGEPNVHDTIDLVLINREMGYRWENLYEPGYTTFSYYICEWEYFE